MHLKCLSKKATPPPISAQPTCSAVQPDLCFLKTRNFCSQMFLRSSVEKSEKVRKLEFSFWVKLRSASLCVPRKESGRELSNFIPAVFVQ